MIGNKSIFERICSKEIVDEIYFQKYQALKRYYKHCLEQKICKIWQYFKEIGCLCFSLLKSLSLCDFEEIIILTENRFDRIQFQIDIFLESYSFVSEKVGTRRLKLIRHSQA